MPPRKRATRVNKRAKPKVPDGEVGTDMEYEEKQKQLDTFLRDFDVEVKRRLKLIADEKVRLQHMIEKEINLQINALPPEVRNMNIMDFVAAGGTVEAAMSELNGEESFSETVPGLATIREGFMAAKAEGEGARKKKGTCKKGKMPPPSVMSTAKKSRSRFQTPTTCSRGLPAVWDTPAITPKFDVNLPFTPGIARAPKNGERLMSLAGSPIDISSTVRASRTVRHTKQQEEQVQLNGAVERVAAEMPDVAHADIHRILSLFTAARNATS